jgi:MFS family permease
MTSPVLPLYAQALGAGGVVLGLVVSGYFISKALVELPSGMMGDRIGCRTPILIGILVGMLGSLFCAVSKSPHQLLFGRMLSGFGNGLFFCTGMILVTRLFGANMRGKALGIYMSVDFLGGFVGPIAGGFVANLVGFANIFYLSLILLFSAFLLAFFSLDLKSEACSRIASQSWHPVSYTDLRSLTLAAVGVVALLRSFEEAGLIHTVLPVYANRFLGIDVSLIGILMGMRAAGYASAVIMAGVICDKIGRKRTLLMGIMMTGCAVFLLGVSKSFVSLMMFSVLAGAGSAHIMVPLPALAAESVPQPLQGTALGVFRTLLDTGAIIGPISLTALSDLAGPTACFYLTSVVILSSALPTALIRDKPR